MYKSKLFQIKRGGELVLNCKTLIDAIKNVSNEENKGITFIKLQNNEKFISYRDLYEQSLIILSNLQILSVRPMDKIIFQINDNEKFMNLFWACILGRITSVPLPIGNNNEQCMKLFKVVSSISNVKIVGNTKLLNMYEKVAIDNDLNEEFKKIRENFININDLYKVRGSYKVFDSNEDDIAVIQFSSGSTGTPKGVTLTHDNLISNINSIIEFNKITQKDSFLTWLPMTHDLGLILCHILPIIMNINQFNIQTDDFIKNPLIWMDSATDHKITILQSPNFGYKHLLSALKENKDMNWNLMSVRIIYNGAEPISEELCNTFLNEMKKYNLKKDTMTPGYGLAECSVVATVCGVNIGMHSVVLDRRFLNIGKKVKFLNNKNDKNAISFVSVGKSLPNCYLKIADKEGNILDDEIIGYINVKGRNVTRGYYENKELTNEVIKKDGWLNTLDLGFLKNSNLIIIGRAKDIIIVNGQNYYSHDIERIINGIGGMESCQVAACGSKDAVTGSDSLVIFVVFNKSISEFYRLSMKLKKYLNINLGLKVNHIIPIRKLPKTQSGKVQRFKLLKMYESGEFQSIIEQLRGINKDSVGSNVDNNEINENSVESIEENLISICKEILNIDQVYRQDSFFEMGVNSLLLSQIMRKINNLYKDGVEITDFFTYPTIAKLALFIKRDNNCIGKCKVNDNKSQDMAIIGMACKFPLSDNVSEFWNNILNRIDCIRNFPSKRVKDIDEYLLCKNKSIDNIKYEQAGYIDEIDKFDSNFFKVIPKEAIAMNPTQRIFLETAWEAMEDAGYGGNALKGSKTGIYIGYIGDLEGYKYKQILDYSDDKFTATGSLSSVIAGRLSHFMDFKGPSVLIDTACSSSLMSLHFACKGIQNGDCDQALVGGIKLKLVPIDNGKVVGTESSDYRARTFDNKADGTGEGEGIGVILVKPLEKAIADNDNIYSIIKGSAVNQDGNSIGISAPNPNAQTEVIVNAWENSHVNPDTIQYIEAHGTGTKLGDPIEIKALSNAFEKYTDKKQFCAIGSLKTNIGHLYEASGIASIIKVSLALKNKIIPPTNNFTEPNQNIDFCNSPLYVSLKKRNWSNKNFPRRAAINSFGFSGTNCHVVLEEAPENYYLNDSEGKETRIFTISAQGISSLKRLVDRYKCFLKENKNLKISNICYTSNVGRGHYNYRAAFLVKSREELLDKLYKFEFHSNKSEDIYYGEYAIVSNNKIEKTETEMTNKEIEEISKNSNEVVLKFLNCKSYERKYLQNLCKNYVKGAEILWKLMYESQKVGRISLPTYAFEHKRFWPKLNIHKLKNERSGIDNMVKKDDFNNSQIKESVIGFLEEILINTN